MKLAIATVATLLATNVSAESIVSFGGEMDANYAVDAERMEWSCAVNTLDVILHSVTQYLLASLLFVVCSHS